MKLKVIAKAGRQIAGLGSREFGEVFENVPTKLAKMLAERDEGLELIRPPQKEEENAS